jgi:hypothetical protein
MSTIRVSVLPEQAVAPPVVELVEATGIRSVEQWGFDTYNCGCALRHNDRHWVLCRYHDGMNDGLAMAAAPTPTPDHCPTCDSSEDPERTMGGHWTCYDPWHDSGQP